jgi:ComF family protein
MVPGAPAAEPAPVPIDVCSPFATNDASLEVVRLIKFSNRRSLAKLAGHAMSHTLLTRRGFPAASFLVPVPMHPESLRRRGFNQARLLADAMSAVTGIPVRSGILRKTAKTRLQSKTPRSGRFGNVTDAFVCTGGNFEGAHVYLVDDLVTTGATAASCAAVLMSAGARSVTIASLANSV